MNTYVVSHQHPGDPRSLLSDLHQLSLDCSFSVSLTKTLSLLLLLLEGQSPCVLHNISCVWRQRCMQDRNNMSRTSSPLASCFINADNRVELAKFSYDAVTLHCSFSVPCHLNHLQAKPCGTLLD